MISQIASNSAAIGRPRRLAPNRGLALLRLVVASHHTHRSLSAHAARVADRGSAHTPVSPPIRHGSGTGTGGGGPTGTGDGPLGHSNLMQTSITGIM